MSFGDRIKARRKRFNMTQQDLAEKLGLSLVMVKKMEGNKKQPSFETLEKLSAVLDASTDFLMGRVDDPDADVEQVYRDYIINLPDSLRFRLLLNKNNDKIFRELLIDAYNNMPPKEYLKNFFLEDPDFEKLYEELKEEGRITQISESATAEDMTKFIETLNQYDVSFLVNKINEKLSKNEEAKIVINDDELSDDEKIILVDELELYLHVRKSRIIEARNRQN